MFWYFLMSKLRHVADALAETTWILFQKREEKEGQNMLENNLWRKRKCNQISNVIIGMFDIYLLELFLD